MGKRSKESQRRRRAYKKRTKSTANCEPSPVVLHSAMPPSSRSDSVPGLSHASESVGSSFYTSQMTSPSDAPFSNTSYESCRSMYDTRSTHMTCMSLMQEVSDSEFIPVVVCDKKRKIEVHISDPEVANLPGSEVLKLSAKEYIKRLNDKEDKSKIVIKCLRNRVESLQKEVSDVKQFSQISRAKAVEEVTKIWRDKILECGSYGGKMLNAALKKK